MGNPVWSYPYGLSPLTHVHCLTWSKVICYSRRRTGREKAEKGTRWWTSPGTWTRSVKKWIVF